MAGVALLLIAAVMSLLAFVIDGFVRTKNTANYVIFGTAIGALFSALVFLLFGFAYEFGLSWG